MIGYSDCLLHDAQMKTLKDIRPGQTVGRYEFLVPIAQGGMAAVWAARQRGSRGFSKTVAVKTMLPSISDDPRFEQMFLDEARIASRIRHPNVAEILDLGEQDDVLYLVMEWVDGEPLNLVRHTAVEHAPFPLPIAVKIIMDACSGLHAAHELVDEDGKLVGLVHRDISPQNVLVGYDGVVKLVDFGVAKTAGRTTETTHAGQVKGKPPYMSPEQALGKTVDRRTDLFALGIVLYQLTTGRHPMRGESDVITLHNIVSSIPIVMPSKLCAAIPTPLERVMMKALERDPDERFQTAREFGMALEQAVQEALPRVRTEEVGEFVTHLLGLHGEERRAAVRESIRLADERGLAARYRAREEEATWVGLQSAMSDPDSDVSKPDLPLDAGNSPPTWANELTQVDSGVKLRSIAPMTLWIGISVGVILGAAAFWAFTRSPSAKHPSVAVRSMPSSEAGGLAGPTIQGTAQILRGDADKLSLSPGVPSTAAPTISVRRTQTKNANANSRQGAAGHFTPPPVSNPGF
jgi:serine/threonine protein kinase